MPRLGVEHARRTCADLIWAKDRSAFVLSKYVPGYVQDAYLGLRAFNVETARAVDGASERKVAALRLEFWKTAIQRIHRTQNAASDAVDDEPVTTLLRHVVTQGINLPKRYLLTLVQSREARLSMAPLLTVEDMERVGEGTHSQLLYALLDAMQSGSPAARDSAEYLAKHPELDELVSNTLAHIGQATGIAGLLRAFQFYVQRHNYVNLPVDLLAKYGISQQKILDGGVPLGDLKDIVFEVATRANDHVLTARSLFQQLAAETGGVPTFFLLPAMHILPVALYLEKLEKHDFDLGRTASDWKLPWRSWRAWSTRRV